MEQTPSLKRFKTNPVELVIFLAITGVFMHSVYQLFYESPNFRATALAPMHANPLSEGRSPASTSSQSFMNLDVRCENNAERDTSASKVRLNGALCGADASEDSSKLTKTSVVNTANKFNATVFTDTTANKFSTDYIPLNPGRNAIHIEFAYRSGKIVSQDVVIQKN